MNRFLDVSVSRRSAAVTLRPLDSPELIDLVAGWLSQKANYQWLDFGDGQQRLTPAWLKIMTQQDTNLLRVFTADEDDTPIGVIGLTEINRRARTARVWAVVGDKSFRARGYATQASFALLTVAFRELGMEAVNTWVVEGNSSRRIVERLGFNYIGRQRECHCVDGRPLDRLWFDVLESELKEP
jgi:RimJ/RimL family protein N-acetyltransferase